jgi:hypothetical protein
VAHELSHIVLESTRHPLRSCEKVVDLTVRSSGSVICMGSACYAWEGDAPRCLRSLVTAHPLVADDTGGAIWRITYTGQRDAAQKNDCKKDALVIWSGRSPHYREHRERSELRKESAYGDPLAAYNVLQRGIGGKSGAQSRSHVLYHSINRGDHVFDDRIRAESSGGPGYCPN